MDVFSPHPRTSFSRAEFPRTGGDENTTRGRKVAIYGVLVLVLSGLTMAITSWATEALSSEPSLALDVDDRGALWLVEDAPSGVEEDLLFRSEGHADAAAGDGWWSVGHGGGSADAEGVQDLALAGGPGAVGEPIDGDESHEVETDVRAADLGFPHELAEPDVRPEVEAAVAAAAAEYMHPDAMVAGGLMPEGDALARVEQVLSETRPRSLAPLGSPGKHVLQVISYDNPREAHAFSRLLRARGHHAYVATANVAERGAVWRVRIGPFPTKARAMSYARQLEESDGLGAHVVSKTEIAQKLRIRGI